MLLTTSDEHRQSPLALVRGGAGGAAGASKLHAREERIDLLLLVVSFVAGAVVGARISGGRVRDGSARVAAAAVVPAALCARLLLEVLLEREDTVLPLGAALAEALAAQHRLEAQEALRVAQVAQARVPLACALP